MFANAINNLWYRDDDRELKWDIDRISHYHCIFYNEQFCLMNQLLWLSFFSSTIYPVRLTQKILTKLCICFVKVWSAKDIKSITRICRINLNHFVWYRREKKKENTCTCFDIFKWLFLIFVRAEGVNSLLFSMPTWRKKKNKKKNDRFQFTSFFTHRRMGALGIPQLR